MKKVLLSFIGLVLILGLAACGGESDIEKIDKEPAADAGEPAEEPKEDAAPVEKEPKEPEYYAVGDTVQFDDLLITVNSVKTSTGTNEYDKPENDLYIVLDIVVENKSEETQAISSLMQMSLYDAESYSYDTTFMLDTKGSLDGEIGPGRKMRGEIAFDTVESEYYEFIFEDILTSGQAIWRIEPNSIK